MTTKTARALTDNDFLHVLAGALNEHSDDVEGALAEISGNPDLYVRDARINPEDGALRVRMSDGTSFDVLVYRNGSAR